MTRAENDGIATRFFDINYVSEVAANADKARLVAEFRDANIEACNLMLAEVSPTDPQVGVLLAASELLGQAIVNRFKDKSSQD